MPTMRTKPWASISEEWERDGLTPGRFKGRRCGSIGTYVARRPDEAPAEGERVNTGIISDLADFAVLAVAFGAKPSQSGLIAKAVLKEFEGAPRTLATEAAIVARIEVLAQ